MNNLMSLVFYIVSFISSAMFIQLGVYEKKNRIFIILGLTIPIIIATFRYAVGTDYFNYLFIMNNTGKLNLYEYVVQNSFNELGSYFLYRIGYLSRSYNLMLGIIATLTILPIYFSLKKVKGVLSLSVGILVYLFTYFPTSFNIMMQMIALSIVTLSYKYIFERKIYKYIFVIICASMFHSTALVCVPLYLLWSVEGIKKFFNYRYMIAILVGILFILNINNILIYLGEFDVFSSYQNYAISDFSGANRDLLVKIILFIIVFLFRKSLVKYDERNNLFILLLLFNVFIGFSGNFSPFIKRIGYYFEIVQIYILPMLVRVLTTKRERGLYGVLIILYSISFFILVAYILGQGNIIPYRINL